MSTPADVRDKLFPPLTPERVKKAQGMALRQRLDWQDVLAAMTPEQRAQVEQAR